MDFSALPPEVNSGLLYAGPGSGPMFAAAAAWDGLSADLRTAATAATAVVTRLTGAPWRGPAAVAMSTAQAPYLAWLAESAARAEATAVQARAAAAAYDSAFAMTVPPSAVAANRAQLTVLIATNLLGQNTGAIAATEAAYAEMWAQDAAAMYGYAGASALAVELEPFSPVPNAGDPTAAARPATAAGAAVGKSAGAGAQSALAKLLTAASGVLPAAPALPAEIVPPFIAQFTPFFTFAGPPLAASALATASASWNSAASNSRILMSNTEGLLDNSQMIIDTELQLHTLQREILALLRDGRLTGAMAALAPGGSGAGLVSAGLGEAVAVGNLSVPLNWASAAPAIRTTGYALPAPPAGAVPTVSDGSAGTAFSQMALAGMGGSALAGSIGGIRRDPSGPPAGARSPAAGTGADPVPPQVESPVAEIAAGLRDLGELRDAGLLTPTEFAEQKQRLLAGPLR